MTRRERRRRKVIRVYITRAVAALILVIMLVLMFCGCLYIRDLFKKGKEPAPETDQTVETVDPGVNTEEPEDTQEPEELEPALPLPYEGVSIVIDPGHGGNDGGTVSGDIIEKDINFAISAKVIELLETQGVTVYTTRTTDTYVSLEERVYLANQTTADLFVSLHCNYFEGDESIDGFEAFYCRNADGSRIYAESIVAAASENSNIAIRGATENNYYVTKHTTMDAILIEMGFLSNPAECSKLTTESYQQELAEVIVKGILAPFDEANTETN